MYIKFFLKLPDGRMITNRAGTEFESVKYIADHYGVNDGEVISIWRDGEKGMRNYRIATEIKVVRTIRRLIDTVENDLDSEEIMQS